MQAGKGFEVRRTLYGLYGNILNLVVGLVCLLGEFANLFILFLNEQQLDLFISLFRGRTDAYARRWEKDGRSGYSPAYAFDWGEFMAHKRHGGSMKDFEKKSLFPFSKEVAKKHLLGQHVVGIYPILPDNTSYFIAADFDGENWLADSRAYLSECRLLGLSAYLERSRSGSGGHVWIFFSKPYPCYKSRQMALEVIRKAFNVSKFDKEVSFDRLFPNQDSLTARGFGNLIALPLQGRSMAQGHAMFIDPESAKPFQDQWQFLNTIKTHPIKDLDAIYHILFSDSEVSPPEKSISKILEISVSNQIVLRRAELVPALIKFLKDGLNFQNREYVTKRRLGKSTFQVQKYFKLVEEADGNVYLPHGFLSQMVRYLKENNFSYSLHFKHPRFEESSYDSGIDLTPAQAPIIRISSEHYQGVIVAPAVSGKTIIGLELIARRKLSAIILVHRKQLLDQWVERTQTFLGIPKTFIGQYSGTKKKLGKQITVGLLQSLARQGDLANLKEKFGTIVVDECHHIPAATFREVVSQLNPKYIYGLTATPKRKHNDEKRVHENSFSYSGNSGNQEQPLSTR
ncbi:MAG: DEAD/DEAH box helicase family protein [Candidatus Tectomicrobia bacterium]|uniref:DEAD/DEAH box helicase family protein n=1 Tax=Tectimicrobiota bacterium TaxID=2528274 RepID=A0A933LQ27_UNCTE|nr:DEAD/DEAH box helicase family protein [Candidatus Tectomicrobia bacterium]